MELVLCLPPELAPCADRALPQALRLPAAADGAAGPALAFGDLLQAIEALPAAGEPLPASGNDLPLNVDSAALTAGEMPAVLIPHAVPMPLPATAALAAPASAAPPLASNPLSVPIASSGSSTQPAIEDGAADFLRGAAAAGEGLAAAATPQVPTPRARPLPAGGAPPAVVHTDAPLAPELRPAAAEQGVESAAAAAPLLAGLASQTRDALGPAGRPRLQLRAGEQAATRAAASESPRVEASAGTSAAALASAIADGVPEALVAPAAAQSGPIFAGASALAGDAALSQATTPALTFAAAGGPSAGHKSGAGAPAGALADAFGQSSPQPLDTSVPRWNDALAGRIHWMVDHGIGEARIKLNPPELGALDVKISMLDDKTFVQLAAISAAARDEISQTLARLRELLTSSGLDVGNATVTDSHDHPAEHPHRDGASAPRAVFATLADTGTAPPRAHRAATQIDLYA